MRRFSALFGPRRPVVWVCALTLLAGACSFVSELVAGLVWWPWGWKPVSDWIISNHIALFVYWAPVGFNLPVWVLAFAYGWAVGMLVDRRWMLAAAASAAGFVFLPLLVTLIVLGGAFGIEVWAPVVGWRSAAVPLLLGGAWLSHRKEREREPQGFDVLPPPNGESKRT